MKSKPNPVILVGAALAIVGVAVLAVLALRHTSSSGKKVDVLVAGAPVAAGTPAASAGLVVQKLPASAVPAGALSSPAAVAGQVALRSVVKGEVIVPGTFGTQGVAAAGGVVLPAGKEGLAVELGYVPGGLRYVVPGNHITIWATPKNGTSRVLLQNVQVIATTPGTGDGAATAVTPGPGNLDFLLAVDRTEAAQVITAQANGSSLYFTLATTGQKA